MVEMRIDYKGDLRTVITHVPSGAVIETDAPKDNEGRGERFSPTDMLASSLGACSLTIMGIAAGKHGISIEGASVRVEKHMAASPRRVGRVVLEFRLPASLSEMERGLMERVIWECPVRMSIHPDIDVDSSFKYE
jgi:uncharacterized OsmC-like protein